MANRGADKYIIQDSFQVGVEKGITRTFGNAGGGGNKEVASIRGAHAHYAYNTVLP